jgi:hypothetical protein
MNLTFGVRAVFDVVSAVSFRRVNVAGVVVVELANVSSISCARTGGGKGKGVIVWLS